jgi:hypothetical protein
MKLSLKTGLVQFPGIRQLSAVILRAGLAHSGRPVGSARVQAPLGGSEMPKRQGSTGG